MSSIDKDFALLKRRIHLDRGLDCDQYKENYLKRRISVRLRATRSNDYLEYLMYLKRHPEEYKYLMDEITINVTQFFRDKDVYEKICKEAIPRIIEARKEMGSRSLRVWSAGCSSGEEPYSIAMLLDHFYERELKNWNIRIVGSDFDTNSLKRAKRAVYAEIDMLDGMDSRKYFENIGSSSSPAFKLRDDYRYMVRFEEANFFKDQLKRRFDLVLFRNVLIYFDRATQPKILGSIASTLSREGFLVLGKSETLGFGLREKFEPMFPRERIFRLLRDKETAPAPLKRKRKSA